MDRGSCNVMLSLCRKGSGILFGVDASDDELDFDELVVVFLLGVEGGGGGTLDVGGGHAGGLDVGFGHAVFDKEFFDGLGTLEGNELVVLGVDAVGLDPPFDGEGYIGMVLEHLDVVHEVGVGGGEELVFIAEIDVGDGIDGAPLGTVEFHAEEGVLFKAVGIEVVEDGEIAVALGVEGVVESGDELDTATTEVFVVDDDTVVGVLFEDGEVDVDIFADFGVVEGDGDFEGFDKDGDFDAVAGAFGSDVVEHDVVDFALAHIDGADMAIGGGFGEEDVGGLVIHADGAFGGLFFGGQASLAGRLGLGFGVHLGFVGGFGFGSLGFGQEGAVDGGEVHGDGQHFVALDVVAEVGIGVFIDHHVVVVGHILLGDSYVEFAVVGDGELVPDGVVLELGEVGVTFVGHHFHDAAGPLGCRGGTEGLVYIEGDGEKAVVAVVGQLDEMLFGGSVGSLFAFFILL